MLHNSQNVKKYVLQKSSILFRAFLFEKICDIMSWDDIMKKELLNILQDIKYGWVDKNGNVNIDNYENFEKNYILQSPEEIKKNKVGFVGIKLNLFVIFL